MRPTTVLIQKHRHFKIPMHHAYVNSCRIWRHLLVVLLRALHNGKLVGLDTDKQTEQEQPKQGCCRKPPGQKAWLSRACVSKSKVGCLPSCRSFISSRWAKETCRLLKKEKMHHLSYHHWLSYWRVTLGKAKKLKVSQIKRTINRSGVGLGDTTAGKRRNRRET